MTTNKPFNPRYRWKIKKGATRFVVLTSRYAFKIPRLISWKSFLQGLLANMQERTFAQTKWSQLCPVYWGDPLGILVVMPRCMPLRRDFWNSFDFESFRNQLDYAVPVENKYDSFGYFKGKPVAIDYGS